MKWICNKFNFGDSKELVKNIQDETHTIIDPVRQLENEERQKGFDLNI